MARGVRVRRGCLLESVIDVSACECKGISRIYC